MFSDAQIRTAAGKMLSEIDVPPMRLMEIQRKISQPQRVERRSPSFARPAIAAAAAVLVLATLPKIAPALVQGIDAQYRAALQALGGVAPPPAPASLKAKMTPIAATLAEAQSRVKFTIVPPAGLPSDATETSIHVAPVGVYSKTTNAWRVGESGVTFAYHRADGREFVLMVSRYDPSNPLSKYIFEAKDPAADGRPVLVKHERFAWRNGDQVMTAIEGSDISASEIAAIQAAMGGVSVPRRELHAPNAGGDLFYRVIPKPT